MNYSTWFTLVPALITFILGMAFICIGMHTALQKRNYLIVVLYAVLTSCWVVLFCWSFQP